MNINDDIKTTVNFSNLNRLFMLRNLLILGQVFCILLVYSGLNIPIPVAPLSLIITLQILFNIYAWQRIDSQKTISDNEIFLHLLFDVLPLAIVLYFTGGATNPFIILFLFPLTIAVTILPAKYSWILATVTIVCYSILMVEYEPIPISHNMHEHDTSREYDLHIIGMWMAFVAIAGLITYYVFGMGNTLRRQQKLLARARERALQDEKLVSLGTLAASTAHELGTPLATMSLLANELRDQIESNNQPREVLLNDIDNLSRQIKRCELALSDLSASAGASPLENGEAMEVAVYLQDLLNQLYDTHPDITIETDWVQQSDTCIILADRSLTQALINIIDNAIEVSPNDVSWASVWDDKILNITISDRGPGVSEEIALKLGNSPITSKVDGMGLGLYLAHAIIKRMNGKIELSNRDGGGSSTNILLPLIQ